MTSNGPFGKGPGAYYCCAGREVYTNNSVKFYLKHPNLKWIATTCSLAAKVPGAILIKNGFGNGYVGRINVALKNGTFSQIGNIYGTKLFYTTTNLNSYTTTTNCVMDVLACQP